MYSKGLKTVSVAMTQVLPVASLDSAAASLEAASEEASEAASDGALLEAAPPQAARERVIAAAMPKANSFFMLIRSFPLHKMLHCRAAGNRLKTEKGNRAQLVPLSPLIVFKPYVNIISSFP